MPYREKEREKAYQKAWSQEHKDERKAYMKSWRQEHKDYHKAYMKSWRQEHKDYNKAYMKSWRQEHKDEVKAYMKSDTNSLGNTKNSVRGMSRYFLFNALRHTKVEGYEIHHCFGYEDYKNFIYIPKELHLEIHKFLRDNCIDADSDHYSKIEHLIVNYLKLHNRHVLIMHNKEDYNA